ncbi:MAG: RnfABCDGE type electron transport complex subunit G [Azoarcus sp.]|jgi:electron transport complex protein RnfG|nr:RnfABCDGE type electron transport complex subunit G [Azoarcus sp.]
MTPEPVSPAETPVSAEASSTAPSGRFAGLPPALRRALASALGLTAFTIAFTALMAFTHEATRERIDASKEEEQMRLVDEVLPRESYDNTLLADEIKADETDRSANDAGIGKIWRARRGKAPVALVFETFAPNGYGGRINLIVSLDSNGRVGGVRVVSHRETPGLGDYIDPAKDRHKDKPWIAQFAGTDAAQPAGHWAVKKDGGDFDYHTGATVSARAVTRAVGRAVAWVNARRDALFATPADKRPNPAQEH